MAGDDGTADQHNVGKGYALGGEHGLQQPGVGQQIVHDQQMPQVNAVFVLAHPQQYPGHNRGFPLLDIACAEEQKTHQNRQNAEEAAVP